MTARDAPRREPADADERRQALDPTRSFIVQAPAGSGKTELLTQRFLTLLAGVEEPERIVAITFTKKAAAEMRNRILDALRGDGAIARAALARAAAQGWDLLANPQRLRIQTIDSFNAALTRQMPVLTRLGAQPRIVEDSHEMRLEAARLALEPPASGAEAAAWRDAVRHLHDHLDGDLGRARTLIASMLDSRDQWIWHFAEGAPGLSRARLEAALDRVVTEELAAVAASFTPAQLEAAGDLVQVAASNLNGTDRAGGDGAQALLVAAELLARGEVACEAPGSLPIWLGLAQLFLKADGEARNPTARGITAREGFPSDAANKPHKDRLLALLAELREDQRFAPALARVRKLPPTRYSEQHWRVLGAFVEVLRHAFVLLERVFQATGEVDFSEVGLRALRALRDEDMPTDLALALDHRIEHLLVDEFQDTSHNQHELLKRLTEGWAEGDGRTLFVVGDPMQSIYRFRKAEVGLFIQAMEHGIGGVRLAPLRLTENFRSQEDLVAWVNASFEMLFRDEAGGADPADGAVPFAPATASHPRLEGPAVVVHPKFEGDGESEAALVTRLVQEALAAGQGSVAILVAARAHLREIMPALKAAGITPRVTDIEPLAEKPMVRDLVALTRALVHPGDRTAWLAVRRAPWCGQTLAELMAGAPAPKVEAVFAAARARHRRVPLTRLVQGAWLALGGPACARDREDLADAKAYFEFLAEHDVAGDLDDPAALDELMEELHAPEAPNADQRVQVLTMHKAKGLEFDTVILPGLHKLGGREEPALLRWLDRPGGDLLMAALAAAGADADPIYGYVGQLARQQRAAEQLRQLYVATTRPKQRLHLIGRAVIGEEGVKKPPTGSLLRAMWEVVGGEFEAAAGAATEPPTATASADDHAEPRFHRLPAGWRRSDLPAPIAPGAPLRTDDVLPHAPFEDAGETSRMVGVVVHRLLQRIAEDGLEQYAEPALDWDPDRPDAVPLAAVVDPRTAAKRAARIAGLWPAAEALLANAGVPAPARSAALAQVKDAVAKTLADPAGRWVLSPHAGAATEQALTVAEAAGLRVLRLDRWFESGGRRWVVDFKTAPGASIDRLRDRHRAQLERYATAIAASAGPRVETALYLASLGRLIR